MFCIKFLNWIFSPKKNSMFLNRVWIFAPKIVDLCDFNVVLLCPKYWKNNFYQTPSFGIIGNKREIDENRCALRWFGCSIDCELACESKRREKNLSATTRKLKWANLHNNSTSLLWCQHSSIGLKPPSSTSCHYQLLATILAVLIQTHS